MLTQAIVASITVVAIVGKWTGKDFWGEGRTIRARIYLSLTGPSQHTGS
jgi:hypothetical protein